MTLVAHWAKPSMKPRFRRDGTDPCPKCIFLGQWEESDLYIHGSLFVVGEDSLSVESYVFFNGWKAKYPEELRLRREKAEKMSDRATLAAFVAWERALERGILDPNIHFYHDDPNEILKYLQMANKIGKK